MSDEHPTRFLLSAVRMPTHYMDRSLADWRTVADALHVQRGESLRTAAERTIRRAQRLGQVTRRTQVAGLIMSAHEAVDPWPIIRRAAELWLTPC